MYQPVSQQLVKAARGVAKKCSICNKKFELFLREHICKRCLRPVCSECSPKKLIIVGYDQAPNQKHRVCSPCKAESKFQKKLRKENNLQYGSVSQISLRWLQSLNLITTTESHSEIQDLEETYKKSQSKGLISNIDITQMKQQLSYSFKQFAFQTQGKLTDAEVSKILVSLLNKLAFRFQWKTLPNKFHLIAYFVLFLTSEALAYHILIEIYTNYIPSYAIEYMSEAPSPSERSLSQNQQTKIQKILNYLISQYQIDDFSQKQISRFIQFIGFDMLSAFYVDILSFECFFTSIDDMITKNTYMEVERIFIMLIRYHQTYLRDDCIFTDNQQHQRILIHLIRNTSISDLKEKYKGEKTFEGNRTETAESKMFKQSNSMVMNSTTTGDFTQITTSQANNEERATLNGNYPPAPVENGQNAQVPAMKAERQPSTVNGGDVTESDDDEGETQQIEVQQYKSSVYYNQVEKDLQSQNAQHDLDIDVAEELNEEFKKREELLKSEIATYQRQLIKQENQIKEYKQQILVQQNELQITRTELQTLQIEVQTIRTQSLVSSQFASSQIQGSQETPTANTNANINQVQSEQQQQVEHLLYMLTQKNIECENLIKSQSQQESNFNLQIEELRTQLHQKSIEFENYVANQQSTISGSQNNEEIEQIRVQLQSQLQQKTVECQNLSNTLALTQEKVLMMEKNQKSSVQHPHNNACIEQLWKELQSLQQKIEEQRQEKVSLEQQLLQEKEQLIVNHLRETAILKQEVSEFQQKIFQQEEMKSTVSSEYVQKIIALEKTIQEKEVLIQSQVSQIQVMQTEVQTLKQTEQSLKKELVQKSEQSSSYSATIETQIKELQSNLESMRQTNSSLVQEHKTLMDLTVKNNNIIFEEFKIQIQENEQTIINLRTQLEESRLREVSLNQQVIQMTEKIVQLNEQIAQLGEQIQSVTQSNQELQTVITEKSKTIEQLEQQVLEDKEKMENYERIYQHKEQQIVELRNQLLLQEQTSQQLIEEGKTEIIHLKEQIRILEITLVEVRQVVEQKTLIIVSHEQTIKQLNDNIQHLTESYQTQLQEQQNQYNQLHQSYNLLQQEKMVIEQKIIEITKEVETKILIIHEKEQIIIQLQEKLTNRCEEHEKIIEKLKSKVNRLQNELNKYLSVFNSVKTTVTNVEEDNIDDD
ncbi:FYVE zinc finger protein (macronuclear) [Tetrahymena thermophila SB210]|uniref:FYVE zinc finger protein n=1 Tax=Tetrahymena thermophila (strain SB210) TaxID=312017 RepID=Q22RB7_TETTS|nr:FYVE zinc finger protein [Tetrahymena thermophila SB210]EAR88205.2 FYVE zinc finger protein [Tetrahymena thermophila SB210]|eukprot:XP_001008450.2 FYVE zinc finger protein [Tetrahymena thermophila SB210]